MRVSCLPTPIVARKFGSLAWPAPRGAALIAVCLVLGACGDGSDEDLPSATQLRATCASIVGKQLGAVTVSAAKRYEADSARGTPAFCQVQATQPPYLDFEVVLPDNWSGRLWQQGGGGFDGFIDSAVVLDAAGKVQALSRAVGQQAAVYATSNGGNRQSVAAEAGPMVWFDGTPAGAQSLQDYDYASVGKTVHSPRRSLRSSMGASHRRPTFRAAPTADGTPMRPSSAGPKNMTAWSADAWGWTWPARRPCG